VEYIAIAVGGTYECWARYGSPTIYEHDFPHATLSTNVLGSFLMAFPLIETFEPLERLTIAPEHRSGLLIDVLYILTGDYAAGRSLLLSRAHMLLALCKRAAMPVELTVEQAARLARRRRPSADYAPLMCQMVQKGRRAALPNHRHFGYQPGNKQRNKSDEDRFMHSRLHFQLARMRAYSG